MAYRIKELNGKRLEGAIKRGISTSELCRDYGCTEAQLERQISQIYNGRTARLQGIWRALKNNDRAKAIKRNGEFGEVEVVIDETEPISPEDEAARKAKRALEEQVRKLTREGDKLMREIGELDEEIAKAQQQYDSCEPHVFEAMEKIELAKQKVASAEEELRQKQQKYNELCGIAEEKLGALEELKAKRMIKQSEVEGVQEELWNLTQTTLGVDIMAEEIMIIDGPSGISETQLNFSGAEDVFATLITESECEFLTVRVLKLLALTIAGARNLCMKVKVVCDDDEFVRMFEKFI